MIDRACISLNARCNLNCAYCHFSSKKNNEQTKQNEFSIAEVCLFCQNLIDYIKQHNIISFKLGIVGSGEPLLSFDTLKCIVELFANSDVKNVIKMYVISNGTLLNKDIVEIFFRYKDIAELNISLDGDPEINMKLRGSWPNLSLYRDIFGTMPKINAVVTKEIINNQDRILDFFTKNGYKQINFSKVFGVNDPLISVNDDEYESFLSTAKTYGIESRQNIINKKYDCAKYGRLCGVGKNNIFITRTGVYPCGRFMNLREYVIGSWNDKIDDIEKNLQRFKPCPEGDCYYEFNKVGQ